MLSARRDRHRRANVRRDICQPIPVVAPRAHRARRQRAIHIPVTIHVFLESAAAAFAGGHLARVRRTTIEAIQHAVAIGIHVGNAASTSTRRLLQRVKRTSVVRVVHEVIVVVGVRVVAVAVAVCIECLIWIERERVGRIINTVVVVIGIDIVGSAIVVKVRAQVRRTAPADCSSGGRRAAIELNRDQVAIAIAPGSGNVIARVPHANAHVRAAAGGAVLNL